MSDTTLEIAPISIGDADPVGPYEIAARLTQLSGHKFTKDNIATWKHRKKLPAPRWLIHNDAAWDWADIRNCPYIRGKIMNPNG